MFSKTRKFPIVYLSLLAFGLAGSPLSKIYAVGSKLCSDVKVEYSNQETPGDAIKNEVNAKLEANSDFQKLSPSQREFLKGQTQVVANSIDAVVKMGGLISDLSQKIADKQAQKLENRPDEMNPKKSLEKREKFWRETKNNAKSFTRGLREMLFGTKFETANIVKYFEDQDLVPILDQYFTEHFIKDVNAKTFNATSWSRGSEWNSIIEEFSERSIDDAGFVSLVKKIFENESYRTKFLMTKEWHPDVPNHIRLENSLFESTLYGFSRSGQHFDAQVALVQNYFKYLPKNEDHTNMVKEMLIDAFDENAPMIFLIIQKEAIANFGVTVDISQLVSRTSYNEETVVDANGVKTSVPMNLEKSNAKNLARLEKYAESASQGFTQNYGYIQLQNARQFSVILDPKPLHF